MGQETVSGVWQQEVSTDLKPGQSNDVTALKKPDDGDFHDSRFGRGAASS